MQKKVINGALVLLCIVIYTSIFFKAFSKKEVMKNDYAVVDNYKSIDLSLINHKDSIALFFPKRSPFGEPINSTKIIDQSFKTKRPKAKQIKETMVWPKILYYGFVKNSNNSQKLAIVKVNNILHKTREGTQLGKNLKVVRAYSDSIIISFYKDIKTLKRQ